MHACNIEQRNNRGWVLHSSCHGSFASLAVSASCAAAKIAQLPCESVRAWNIASVWLNCLSSEGGDHALQQSCTS